MTTVRMKTAFNVEFMKLLLCLVFIVHLEFDICTKTLCFIFYIPTVLLFFPFMAFGFHILLQF